MTTPEDNRQRIVVLPQARTLTARSMLHLAVVTAKLCGSGSVRAVIAENLVLKQQLIVLRRARQRARNLTPSDRLLCGFWSIFLPQSRRCLDHVLFWNAGDLERKLTDFQAYDNAARSHASLEGHTPLTFACGHTVARAELNNVRWVSHCRDLVQLPVAA
jgi:hypothetical protein